MTTDPGTGVLDALAASADVLEPSPSDRHRWLTEVGDRLDAWLAGLEDSPAAHADDDVARKALAAQPIGAPAGSLSDLLDLLAEAVDRPGVTVPSPHFFGFIPTGAVYPSALADLYSGVIAKYTGKPFGAPGAARVDRQVVEWLAELVGYPSDCAGDLTSGASLATLSAVVAARQWAGVRAADVEQVVVYVTEQTHAAVGKALRIAGLGDCVVSTIPIDDRFRLRPDALQAAIDRHLGSGLRPWLVVATAGTTDTGAVDPLEVVADIAEAHDLWFHVDAAYGGAFGLTETGRRLLRGIERSDSVALDPHKGLSMPFGSGALLVRRPEALEAAFSVTGACIRDADSDEPAAADQSAELTRPFRGLRLWLPLQLFGVAPFRDSLDLQLLLARHAHRRLSEIPGLVVNPEPDLTVVSWRVAPPGVSDEQSDDLTQAVLDAIQREGRIFVSSTVIADRVAMRMAILNHRVRQHHVDEAVDVIARHVASVCEQAGHSV